ncbi:uncharacterized protein L969DRAFT_24816 [Mixia osmundae IAM 14324]|uniref:Uncharacterized protein n=1 Tax=Mixia osmundae (strain CBS 9802 / IAM 14324 / JCM 22182 / KY 12970) TaxID=764103 RepID=G7E0G5_MIXOS|nr:uncharacterized protein L969DRAFT_24816 [Mixia osmundae IAM 14324]KEI38334.1 hypothetical protein L969DRAFT_24816 [Mixia osmundae IAM 14324]GAA96325.1 hypothetical protein E5Q_02991 [Mixia osmundae IAM 14324]
MMKSIGALVGFAALATAAVIDPTAVSERGVDYCVLNIDKSKVIATFGVQLNANGIGIESIFNVLPNTGGGPAQQSGANIYPDGVLADYHGFANVQRQAVQINMWQGDFYGIRLEIGTNAPNGFVFFDVSFYTVNGAMQLNPPVGMSCWFNGIKADIWQSKDFK